MPKRNYVRTDRARSAAWKKRAAAMLIVLGGVSVLWSLIMGEMGVVKYMRMKSQEHALRVEIEHLKKDNLRLLEEVRALKYDSAYIERIARDKIGLARPGEIVYYYGETDMP